MQPELLLFDIGNTCIKVGLADSRGVMTSYNLRTDPAQTSDSLGLTLLELLRHAGAETRFTACVASSVVPGFDPLLREAVQRYLGCPLWMVPQDMPIPLQNHYERPQEVGADRLVGAYEARRLHPGPESLIVVDFGTAVTFDCISGNAYLGGLIFPGPRARNGPAAPRQPGRGRPGARARPQHVGEYPARSGLRLRLHGGRPDAAPEKGPAR